MLAANIIRPSTSPWAFPVTLAKKKDGSDRFCVDYRKLNAVTIDEHTPLPHIGDLLQRVAKARVFSTLDLAWGYWQLAMAQESIPLTAFVTADGQYEFVVLPFGLKNAPSSFQRHLQRILRKYRKRGVVNYLDDIVVFTLTVEEMQALLIELVSDLMGENIRLRFEKCTFFAEEIELFGHVVGHDRIGTSPQKIKAMVDLPTPKTKKNIQEVAGLTNYYKQFVPGY
ncbi:putative retrotransposon protein-like protein, partial [Leptotrombidium deliense]